MIEKLIERICLIIKKTIFYTYVAPSTTSLPAAQSNNVTSENTNDETALSTNVLKALESKHNDSILCEDVDTDSGTFQTDSPALVVV